jgi:hypothetical protein
MNKGKIITGLVVLLVVFLGGFIPQYLDKRRLQEELEQTRTQLSASQLQNDIDQARNLAGKMLLEASRQNYGTAAEHSTNLFNHLRELADKAQDASLKTSILSLMETRDSITSGLAQGSPSIIPEIQALMQRMYELPGA